MSDGINLCFIDMMHQCSFEDGKKHKHCTFYEKNRFMDICSGFRKGSFCQCDEAYPTAKTIPVKEADLPNICRGEKKDIWKKEVWGDSVNKQMKYAGRYLDSIYVPHVSNVPDNTIGLFRCES